MAGSHAEATYAPLTKTDVYAIKALADGKADANQQIDALNLIIDRLAETYDLCHRPLPGKDGLSIALASAFVDGRRSVGIQIRRIITHSVKALVPDDPKAPTKVDGDLKV